MRSVVHRRFALSAGALSLAVAGIARIASSQSAAPAPNTCPTGSVSIAGGTFSMGSAEGQGADDERPQRAVTISAFCVDRTEVTVARYAACVAAGACTAAGTEEHRESSGSGLDGRLRTSVDVARPTTAQTAAEQRFANEQCNGTRADRQDHPVNCVDWNQARAYCEWSSGRLPTEAEWEFAARGTDGRRYPWGNAPPIPTLANVCRGECAAAANRAGRRTTTQFTGTDAAIATHTVGRFLAGSTRTGLFDMAGNVAEWTGDLYGHYPEGPVTDPSGTPLGTGRVVRGGGWTAVRADEVSVTTRASLPSSTRAADVGIRCVHPLHR